MKAEHSAIVLSGVSTYGPGHLYKDNHLDRGSASIKDLSPAIRQRIRRAVIKHNPSPTAAWYLAYWLTYTYYWQNSSQLPWVSLMVAAGDYARRYVERSV